MSFMKTLFSVGVGFAAAKGLDKYNKMGGMTGLQRMMGQAGSGASGGNTMAGMMAAMGGAAASTGGTMADLFSSMTEGTAAGQIAEDNAKLMIRAMIMAAKADGEIDSEEQAKILEHLSEADPEEMAFVKEQLAAPVDPMALARDVGEQSRAQVYSMSLMAITVDNQAELQYLDALAQALQLDDETRAQIHRQMGVNQ